VKIRKGDNVIVITGKDKGKTGEVLAVFPKENRLIVSGVNMVTKHQKPSMKNQTGGIVRREAPLHISNVMYLEKGQTKGTRIQYKVLEDGRKVRVAKASGETIE
jgi:large subunit ribosomal protein L24